MGAIQELDEVFKESGRKIEEINSKQSDAKNNTIASWRTSATKSLDDFIAKNEGNSNISQVQAELDRLRDSISTIGSKSNLDEFNRKLSAVKENLRNIERDNKLGTLFKDGRTFENISEVKANIDSLFSSIGKVNQKSVRINGMNKLTAEVKMANGEIHKMNVSLDSKDFARYVDAGIVQFGRLRSAAEGVFKGIYNMMRIYISPYRFIQYFRQGIDKIKEMDTAITELRKVSDAPLSDITAYFDDAALSAKELGSSIKDMIGATADWARMGMKYCSVIW